MAISRYGWVDDLLPVGTAAAERAVLLQNALVLGTDDVNINPFIDEKLSQAIDFMYHHHADWNGDVPLYAASLELVENPSNDNKALRINENVNPAVVAHIVQIALQQTDTNGWYTFDYLYFNADARTMYSETYYVSAEKVTTPMQIARLAISSGHFPEYASLINLMSTVDDQGELPCPPFLSDKS